MKPMKIQRKMKNDMTGLLNLAYEIEGLLMLHINRGDEASPEMMQLLVSKAKSLVDGLTDSEESAVVAAPLPVESIESDGSDCCRPSAHVEEMVEETVEAVDAVDKDADDAGVADSAMSEELEDACPDSPSVAVCDKAFSDDKLTLDEKLARDRAADISKAFTINDKFRFRRELFRGSDEEFKETLDVIASMSSMDEAEEYFYNDLCWDADNEDVKEFMAIVAKHF